jgi:Icc-related predicted phosphoesterase
MDIKKIDLSQLSEKIKKYENKWVAISSDNVIVSGGLTYREALERAKSDGKKDVVLFKVPSLKYSLSPHLF